MRKGKRIEALEWDRRHLWRLYQGLCKRVELLCPHDSLEYRGLALHDPAQYPVGDPPRIHTFRCPLCGQEFRVHQCKLDDADPQFRKILEACGALSRAGLQCG